MTRLLVIDAYTDVGRESLSRSRCNHAGPLYQRMLYRLDPSLQLDVITASAPRPELPPGAALTDYDGVIWTGSNLTAHKPTPEVMGQTALLRDHMAAGVPGFGSCWGVQLVVVAAGGTVAANPKGREFGVSRKITLTEAGRCHPMFANKPQVFDGYTSHEDEVTELPAGATLLAGNAFSRVQALAVELSGTQFWSVQYHPEYELEDVARLSAVRRNQLIKQSFFANKADGAAYAEALEALHHDRSLTHLALRMGLDSDVLDPEVRTAEVAAWLRALSDGL